MKQYIKETRFYHHTFLFFLSAMACFSLTLCKNLPRKIVSILRMDEKKLHTLEFQLKGIGRIQNLADALSLKYIKLVIPRILFILVLCSFNFFFKVTRPSTPPPPPQQYNPSLQNKNFWLPSKDFSEIFTPSPTLEGGCMSWVITMVCTKQFCSGQMGYLGPKIAHLHNSLLTRRVFLKFCRIKRANR